MGPQLEHAAFYPRIFNSDCENHLANRGKAGESGGLEQKALMLRPGALKQQHGAVLFYCCCSVAVSSLRPLRDDDATTQASCDKSEGDRNPLDI
jgi:hypothetical protein